MSSKGPIVAILSIIVLLSTASFIFFENSSITDNVQEEYTISPLYDGSVNSSDYEIVNGRILKYTGTDETVSIPSVIDSMPVTGIGSSAFTGTDVKSVTIPDSVTEIRASAFSGCQSLESVSIGNGMKTIGKGAFEGLGLLESVSFGNSLKTIEENAFRNCVSIESIDLSNGVSVISHYAFSGCTSLESADVGSGITEIGRGAFKGCTSLESIKFPDGLTTIGQYAFEECSLRTVVIPDSVTFMGGYVFKNCRLLERVHIGSGITEIMLDTFNGCSSLRVIDIPEGITAIGAQSFFRCTSLKCVIIPDSVTSIGGVAFNGCTSLESLTLGNGLESIGWGAFTGCTSLEHVDIPDSLTTMNYNAFTGCTSLKSVTIPGSVTSIGWSAFHNCSSLESVTISDGVTEILSSVFNGCSSLESIVIPASVTNIVQMTFNNCPELKTIVLLGEDVHGLLPTILKSPPFPEDRTVYIRECVAGENFERDWDTDIFKIYYSSGIEEIPGFIVEYEDSDNVRLNWFPAPYSVIVDGEERTCEYLGYSIYYREVNGGEWILYGNDIIPHTESIGAEGILLENIPGRESCEFRVVFHDGFVERSFEGRSIEDMSKITWKIDGSDDVINWISNGETPSYKGIPSKASTLFADYSFVGWSPAITEATEYATYVAIFSESAKTYTVTWNIDGTVFRTDFDYGTEITVPEILQREHYEFLGWDTDIPDTMPANDLYITATWSVDTYLLTWIVGDTEITDEYGYGSAIVRADTPSREGYVFAGWDQTVPATMPAENLTVTATWSPNTYHITWIVEDVRTVTEHGYGSPVAPMYPPVLEGRTFAGWDTDVPDTMLAENLEIKATWNVKTYSVFWIFNGSVLEEKYGYGSDILPIDDPVREGYRFEGWDRTVPGTMPSENIIASAEWSMIPYTVTWTVDGVPMTEEYYFGEELAEIDNPVKEGYTFLGWNREIPISMPAENLEFEAVWELDTYTITWIIDDVKFEVLVVYGFGIHVPDVADRDGRTFVGWDKDVPDTMSADDLTITAMWSPNMYSVTWVVGDDRITDDYPCGANIVPISNPVSEGYSFVCWNKDIPAAMPSENLTFVAMWDVGEYTLTFDMGGYVIKTYFGYGSEVHFDGIPERQGYEFAGWDRELPTVMPAENLTVTADWTPKTYTVHWMVDGKVFESTTVRHGEIPAEPEDIPVRESDVHRHYEFDKWSPEPAAVIHDTEYSALFTETFRTYTVTFDTNGGGGTAPSPVSMVYGTVLLLSPTDGLYKDGHVMEGWSTASSGEAIDRLEVNDDVNVYAVWNVSDSEDEGTPLILPATAATLTTALVLGAALWRMRLSKKTE